MKTSIQVFKNEMFGEIRTVTNQKGETFFVGKDIAKALGYNNTTKAIRDHVEKEDKLEERFVLSGQNRKVVIVNESGLYSLILSSKLEQAKAFKRWVTSEVLPQIRKTGGYIPTRDAEGRVLSNEEIVERACIIMRNTIQMVNAQNEDCLTATQVAGMWGMDVMSFNNLLMSMGIQQRKGGRWQLSNELRDKGLTEVRSFYCFSLKGKQRTTRYMVWTPKGVDFLNMAVRKMPREFTANVQLNFNF